MQKISVIVPVHNGEKYLDKCINSIIDQTYKNIEIIIINDGSTDNSENIINKFSKNNPGIVKAYKIKNHGVSYARNYGVENVTGDYFLFVDVDDYIDNNLIEKLTKTIEKDEVDIIKYKLKIINNSKEEKTYGPTFEKTSGEDAFNKLCYTDILIDSPCLYLFNTKYFMENKFKFANNRYHEDFGLIPLVILKAKKVISTDIYGYNYVQSECSITRNDNYEIELKKANDLLYHYDNMINEVDKIDISNDSKKNIYIYYTNAILNRINKLQNKDKRNYLSEIKDRNMINNIKNRNIKSYIKFLYYKFIVR